MRTPIIRWLSFRVRIVLVLVLLVSGFLPPYVPRSALSMQESEVPPPQFLFVEEGFLMKSSSLGQQGARLAYGEAIIHKVKKGDTLNSIATRYHISTDTIRFANNLIDGVPVQPDQEIVILPVDGVMHFVRRGQTLAAISQLYDVPQEVIARQNKVKGSFIVAGQQLIIPGAKPIAGLPPAIASAQETLRFTDKLPDSDIQLRLKQIGQTDTRPQVTGSAPKAPPDGGPGDTGGGILGMPCKNCYYTQYYHPGHFAVDIQTRGGGPIFASEAGEVIRADNGGWNGGYGNVVEIDHGNGLITLYAHNKELYVAKGDKVERGQVIAWMGNTGFVYGATGIHTHFEVRANGVKKNPVLYLQ